MAASESLIGLLQAVSPDKYLHTLARTYAGTVKEDQGFFLANSGEVTYTATCKGIITTTAGAHLAFIQADGTNYTRLYGVFAKQSTLSGAVNTVDISGFRTTTAGSGGGAISARPMDTGDTNPYAGTIQTLPSSKGTESDLLFTLQVGVTATNPMTSQYADSWQFSPFVKPIILGTAASGGCAVKQINAVATNKLDLIFLFGVTAHL